MFNKAAWLLSPKLDLTVYDDTKADSIEPACQRSSV